MNTQEFQKWEQDARQALLNLYTPAETEVVLRWFRNIKGQEERDLVGNEEVESMLKFVCAQSNFNMYNSLMSRLFIYAPLILKEHGPVTEPAMSNKFKELAVKVGIEFADHGKGEYVSVSDPAQIQAFGKAVLDEAIGVMIHARQAALIQWHDLPAEQKTATTLQGLTGASSVVEELTKHFK